jgi:hypothetical protein
MGRHNSINPAFVDQVRALSTAGISQTEAARQLGVTRYVLNHVITTRGIDWPTNRRLRPVKQLPVAKAINCTVTKFAASGYSQPRPIHVSLPPPPCGIVFTADRSETDPTARTIRDPQATWQRDRILASAGRVRA